jgi:hypothetical protein
MLVVSHDKMGHEREIKMSYRDALDSVTLTLGEIIEAIDGLQERLEDETDELYRHNDPDDFQRSRTMSAQVSNLHQLGERLIGLRYAAAALASMTEDASAGRGRGFDEDEHRRTIQALIDE